MKSCVPSGNASCVFGGSREREQRVLRPVARSRRTPTNDDDGEREPGERRWGWSIRRRALVDGEQQRQRHQAERDRARRSRDELSALAPTLGSTVLREQQRAEGERHLSDEDPAPAERLDDRAAATTPITGAPAPTIDHQPSASVADRTRTCG